MLNRREFLQYASAGVVCVGCGIGHAFAQPAGAPRRPEVMVGGRRVKTVDVHAHCAVPAVLDVVKGTPFETAARRQLDGNLGFPVAAARVADMDKDGIDVQALSINAFWYAADRDLARRMFDLQSEKLAEMCKAIPGRFLGYAPVSLQFPELAAEQLERGMKQLGLVGAAIGGGFLPSYATRMNHGCSVFPDQCKGPTLKKKPSEYLKQLYFDSLVFTAEALRHLVNEHGASQIMIGTDYAALG